MDYISPEDKARLEEQLRACIEMRPKIVERIAEARALGDLKENAEYHAAREDQGMNEAKIRDLEQRLENALVMSNSDMPEDMVFLGARVKLRDTDTEAESIYKLVGEASGDFDSDEIEVTTGSPMGESLMRSRVGEIIRVDLRRGPKRFEIVEIL